jgi:hypothetical protein
VGGTANRARKPAPWHTPHQTTPGPVPDHGPVTGTAEGAIGDYEFIISTILAPLRACSPLPDVFLPLPMAGARTAYHPVLHAQAAAAESLLKKLFAELCACGSSRQSIGRAELRQLAESHLMPLRPTIMLLGDSITQRAFQAGQWGARRACPRRAVPNACSYADEVRPPFCSRCCLRPHSRHRAARLCAHTSSPLRAHYSTHRRIAAR